MVNLAIVSASPISTLGSLILCFVVAVWSVYAKSKSAGDLKIIWKEARISWMLFCGELFAEFFIPSVAWPMPFWAKLLIFPLFVFGNAFAYLLGSTARKKLKNED